MRGRPCGREFTNHQAIAQQLSTKVFFAHPYHSWERGLNENTNAGRPVPIDSTIHP